MKQLALFDFDGTLTYTDSSICFFKHIYKNKYHYLFRNYIVCLPKWLAYQFGYLSYIDLKKVRLDAHIGHLSNAQFEKFVTSFNNEIINTIIKPSGIEKILWHKNQNHDVWIVSASFDFILEHWCRQNNLKLLTNITEKKGNTCIMLSPDCNFEEKVNRINQAINLNEYERIYAYGDTDGDKPMLKIAQHAYFQYFN